MKCMHCGAEWTAGQSITALEKCPFCGKSLTVMIADVKELSMARVLRQVVDIYGINILADQKRCISLFKDIAPELKNEYKVLSAALSSGVGEFFISCPENERESNIKKAIHSMNYLSNDAKSLVVSSFVDALGWDEEIAKRSLQQEIEKNQNDISFQENQINSSASAIPPVNSNQSANSINGITNAIPPIGSQAANTNAVGNGFSLNKKWAAIAVSVIAVIVFGYLFLNTGSKDSGSSVQSKQVASVAKSNNTTQENKQMNSVIKPNITSPQKSVKSSSKDVIKEARIRNGLLSPTQDTSNVNINKYSARSALGNPINYCSDSNYILVFEGSGKVQYLIRDTLEYKKNNSGTIVEIAVDTAHIENPKIEKPILIGIGGYRFYFNEVTGVAGTNYDKVIPFESYTGDLEYIPRSAAISYYLVTGKKWPKFRYENDFYSRANL